MIKEPADGEYEKFFSIHDSVIMEALARIFTPSNRAQYIVVDAMRGKDGNWILRLKRKMPI